MNYTLRFLNRYASSLEQGCSVAFRFQADRRYLVLVQYTDSQ